MSRSVARSVSKGMTRDIGQKLLATPIKAQQAHDDHAVDLGGYLPFPKLIAPIVPPHTGLTATAQPSIYWYLSSGWNGEIEFAINKIHASDPVLELTLGLPEGKDAREQGFHSVNLADFDLSLEEGVEYEWFVAIVPDPLERTGDLIASGTIKYIKPDSELARQLKVNDKEAYLSYLQNGIWYDGLTLLNQAIEKAPEQTNLRRQRSALMRQVKMSKVADFDDKRKN
ncbi:MAG: DUF928 domain-containing protein [Candidatus Parabeggiatoa sp.]|nr:DUF928 domain-containing protein [Candidatus Parabeggiatoa sp.]